MAKKKLKQYRVCLSFDVQKNIIVNAKDEEEAYDKAYAGEGEIDNVDYEFRDHIETEEI
jgi:hypothetical protein|tara:strand:- start:106 stop:282 length:177 start_codon:yes stop_codon:yes gene_type:complete